MKLRVTAVCKYITCENFEEFLSDNFLAQSAKYFETAKDGLHDFSAGMVLQQLASDKYDFFKKHSV